MITRAALAEREPGVAAHGSPEAAISTAAARRAKLRVAQLLSAPIAFTRRGQAAGNWRSAGSRRCSRRRPTST